MKISQGLSQRIFLIEEIHNLNLSIVKRKNYLNKAEKKDLLLYLLQVGFEGTVN